MDNEIVYSSKATDQKAQYDARTGERIVGLNTESSEIDEGKIYFDIIFYVRMRDGLAKEIPPKEEQYELHRLLGTLLSQTMTAEQKLKLMKQEYDIPVDRHGIRDEVKIMCNLSEGVEEMGYAKGEAAGKSEIIMKMHKKGYSLEQIMDVTDMSEAEIKAIIG